MNDQSSMNKNDQTEPKSWREERWERREARRALIGNRGRGGGLLMGLLLVLLGIVFLLQNYGNFSIPLKNWGALFILIPAIGAFDRSLRIYRNSGNQLIPQARGAFIVGVVLVLVAAVLLLNLNWMVWGPVLIIIAGLGLLINSILPNREQ
jgi:peptidoglycan/LPS O-acetylase OafA/YrhL